MCQTWTESNFCCVSQLSFDLHDEPADELGAALSMCPHLQNLEIIQQNFVFPMAKFLEQTQTCESLCLKASFTACRTLDANLLYCRAKHWIAKHPQTLLRAY